MSYPYLTSLFMNQGVVQLDKHVFYTHIDTSTSSFILSIIMNISWLIIIPDNYSLNYYTQLLIVLKSEYRIWNHNEMDPNCVLSRILI